MYNLLIGVGIPCLGPCFRDGLWCCGVLDADVELLTTECRPIRLARNNSNPKLIFVRKEISVVPTLI